MTEQETQTRRETKQEASAQEKSQEKEQIATEPLKVTDKRQRSAASAATESHSPKPAASAATESDSPKTAASAATESDSPKTGALVGAAKAIEEGVERVGAKAPEIASVVLHKVRTGVSVAYGTSSTLVRDAYHTASDTADKYKHKNEIRKLKAQRDATSARLGSTIYTKIVIDGEAPEKALSAEETTSLLQQIQNLDNEVIRIGKELEKN